MKGKRVEGRGVRESFHVWRFLGPLFATCLLLVVWYSLGREAHRRELPAEESPSPRLSQQGQAPSAAPPPGWMLDQNVRLYTEQGHNFLAAELLPEEGLAVLTREAQAYMWRNQHRSPAECAKAKYRSIPNWVGGLGSQIHVAGVLVAGAVAEGRIWFWDKEAGHRLAQPAHCGTVTNWDCYLRAPTNCSPEIYANADNTARTAEGEWPFPGDYVPPIFLERLAEVAPYMHANETKYWWRAQSAAYIMRFNARTVETVARLRRGEAMVRVGSVDKDPAARVAARLRQLSSGLFPLPRGTVSIHVRHGDKSAEMALVPFSEYLKGAEQLFQWQPLSLQRTMFVSTEDPLVIQQASQASSRWVALYSDIPRHNSNGFEQLALADDMTLLHLTQLLMALECDAWVGTLGSNWNRLIDELRCVWVAKCAQPYKEVGSSWKDYNW